MHQIDLIYEGIETLIFMVAKAALIWSHQIDLIYEGIETCLLVWLCGTSEFHQIDLIYEGIETTLLFLLC